MKATVDTGRYPVEVEGFDNLHDTGDKVVFYDGDEEVNSFTNPDSYTVRDGS